MRTQVRWHRGKAAAGARERGRLLFFLVTEGMRCLERKSCLRLSCAVRFVLSDTQMGKNETSRLPEMEKQSREAVFSCFPGLGTPAEISQPSPQCSGGGRASSGNVTESGSV